MVLGHVTLNFWVSACFQKKTYIYLKVLFSLCATRYWTKLVSILFCSDALKSEVLWYSVCWYLRNRHKKFGKTETQDRQTFSKKIQFYSEYFKTLKFTKIPMSKVFTNPVLSSESMKRKVIKKNEIICYKNILNIIIFLQIVIQHLKIYNCNLQNVIQINKSLY